MRAVTIAYGTSASALEPGARGHHPGQRLLDQVVDEVRVPDPGGDDAPDQRYEREDRVVSLVFYGVCSGHGPPGSGGNGQVWPVSPHDASHLAAPRPPVQRVGRRNMHSSRLPMTHLTSSRHVCRLASDPCRPRFLDVSVRTTAAGARGKQAGIIVHRTQEVRNARARFLKALVPPHAQIQPGAPGRSGWPRSASALPSSPGRSRGSCGPCRG